MRIFLSSILLIFFLFDCYAIKISGTVTDRSGAPVAGALVKFVNTKKPSEEFVAYTNSSGQYSISETFPANHLAIYCYPNPFNRQTVISFHLDQRQRIELAIYNMAGQKIRVVFSGELDSGHHQIVWDGLSQRGAPVLPGVYICSVQAKSKHSAARMIVLGGENIAEPVWLIEDPSEEEAPDETPQIYSVYISGKGFETHQVNGINLSGVSKKDFVIDRNVWTPFSITGDYLGIYNGVDYTPVFIKGINLGTTVPGSWPGQIAISSEQYARWFRMMADAGFNTVRTYTLHYPRFYEELARYNNENPDKPLYLLQGVWLNEDFPNYFLPDLHDLTAEFDQDLRDVIDCLHGKNKLLHRYGKAYGIFTEDVSKWVIGMIIGREIHADEIAETNYSNPQNKVYNGTHLSIANASPSEVWITQRLDRVIAHERKNYNTNRPVSFSNWPTLDPLTHPSEPEWTIEDLEELDLNKITLTDAPGGFFVSYHAYSYFPNFINEDEEYQKVSDEMGPNSYLGYLRDLKKHYTNHPIMIAEFGVPTSWGNARFSFSGMHHGGLTEEEQGKYTMRMFNNIYDTRYCGGVAFSWMDEWFKTTWITNPMSSARRNLWHNITSPENNYGLIQFVPNPEYYNSKKTQNYNLDKISNTSIWHNFAFFNVETTLKSPLVTGDTIWIAFDTYKRNMGESTLPNGKKVLNNRAEFLLRITVDSALFYVTKAYDLYGITLSNSQSPAFQTKATDGDPWTLCRWQNHHAIRYHLNTQDIGKLNICKENEKLSMHHAVQIRSDGILVRIPWTLLQFSDPSSSMVVDDNKLMSVCSNYWACNMQYLNSVRSEGIAVTVVHQNEVAENAPYIWNDWNLNREEILDSKMFIEVEKASLSVIREGLRNTPFTPK